MSTNMSVVLKWNFYLPLLRLPRILLCIFVSAQFVLITLTYRNLGSKLTLYLSLFVINFDLTEHCCHLLILTQSAKLSLVTTSTVIFKSVNAGVEDDFSQFAQWVYYPKRTADE